MIQFDSKRAVRHFQAMLSSIAGDGDWAVLRFRANLAINITQRQRAVLVPRFYVGRERRPFFMATRPRKISGFIRT
jgi:hypothetical protein